MSSADSGYKSFWTTLPGILTAVTGLVTAIAGALTVLYNIGVIDHKGELKSQGETKPPVINTAPIHTPPDSAHFEKLTPQLEQHTVATIIRAEKPPVVTYKLQPETERQCIIQASEKNLGNELDVRRIEPKLKAALTKVGYSVVEDRSQAHYVVDIRANSRKGAEVFGQYTAFVDVEVSVLDQASGKQIYTNALTNIKGIHLDYQSAGMEAFENAAQKVRQSIIPEILERIKK